MQRNFIAHSLLASPGSSSPSDIVKAAFSRSSAFDDPNTYQSAALDWVESTSNGLSEARILQRYALACIYYATNDVPTTWSQEAKFSGPWFLDDGWLSNSNECNWHGISCNQSGYVEIIRLDKNGLTGSFPSEVTLLKASLLELDLTKNMFYNDDMAFLGELTNLQALLLGYNAIVEKGLPLEWKQLTNLRSLDVSYCLFSGPIDDNFFASFPKLEYLDIGGNTFNGPVPNSISSLWALKYLYMEFTGLQGTLDPILKSNLPLIEEIWTDDNPGLSGGIAPEVGNLVSLKSLSLTNCNLSESIPDEMGRLVNMQQLWLSENNLEGVIPEEFGSLKSMKRFHLQSNNLVGSMPQAVCDNTKNGGYLKTLGVDCNVSCSSGCCTCCGDSCSNE